MPKPRRKKRVGFLRFVVRTLEQVAVVGAGYIAVEMAGILHALGSETHLFFRRDARTEG